MIPTNLLQAQFTLERQNEQWYRSLASAADLQARLGAKAYFERSADDEQGHARRVRQFLIDRGVAPVFDALEPCSVSGDYLSLFTAALAREKITTAALNALWLDADDANEDPQTVAFLQKQDGDFPGFIAEQTASEIELADFILRIGRLSMDGVETFDLALLEQVNG